MPPRLVTETDPVSQDDIPTLVEPLPVRSPASAPAEASTIADALEQLRELTAALKSSPKSAALSAELTLTRKTARWRGLAALIAGIAGISYAAFTTAYDRATGQQEDRIEQLERRLDEVADDVSAIADALKSR